MNTQNVRGLGIAKDYGMDSTQHLTNKVMNIYFKISYMGQQERLQNYFRCASNVLQRWKNIQPTAF